MIKFLHKNKHNLEKWIVGLLFFVMIFYPAFSSYVIVLFILTLTINHKLSLQYQSTIGNYLLIIFYFLNLISFFWSENKSSAIFDLEVKFSLLLFPVIFSYLIYSKYSILSLMLTSFKTSILIGTLLLLRSIFNYILFNQFLTYNEYTVNMHPTYFSMYFVLFISFLLFSKIRIKPFLRVFYFFVLTLNVLLSSSKAGIISLLFIILIYFVKKYKLKSILYSLLLLFGLYILLYKTNYLLFISDRIRTSQEIVLNFLHHKKLRLESNSIRLYAWKASINIIKENYLLGVGIGDVHTCLNNYFINQRLDELAQKNINAHNTFLQIWLGIGVLGLIVFIWYLIHLMFEAYKHKIYSIVVFLISISLFIFPTESVLETQAGTIFLGLVFSLINKYLYYDL
jgi:O-antigen ligase